MRKLASVQEVLELIPIKGADKIELAKIMGYEAVVKKGDFKVGELIVYIECDSILPQKPEFEFMRDRKFRVKIIKLRGQISQGLIMPMSILPKGKYIEYSEGDDVTDDIGVKKYDPQADFELKEFEKQQQCHKNRITKFFNRFPWYRKLFFKPAKTSFPSWIKKTDETRVQNFRDGIEPFKDMTFSCTEKLDGQSVTYYLIKNPRKWQFWKPYIFGVCSRNFDLLKPDDSSWWTVAKNQNIKAKLQDIIKEYDRCSKRDDREYVILQGEIIGNGIQGNKYKIFGYKFYAFNLIFPDMTISNIDAEDILSRYYINFVPIVNDDYKLPETINELVEYSKGNSVLHPTMREGIVVRNYEHQISFKVINPDFLLGHDE